MSRVKKVCLWLGHGKNIRYKSGKSHIVGNDKVMILPIELLNPTPAGPGYDLPLQTV